jgi:outer membrane lipoprotein-sorting protein
MKKLFLTLLLFVTVSVDADEVDDVIAALQKNIDKVQDMQCSVDMIINMGDMGTHTQTMKLWTKGRGKMRMEMSAPAGLPVSPSAKSQGVPSGKTTMIINGDKMIMENPEGKKTLSTPRSSLPGGQAAPPGMNLQQDFGDFLKKNKVSVISGKKSLIKNLLSRSETPKEVVLEVIPEEKDPMIQKMEMTVDMERGIITNQKMFSNYGTTKMDMEYENIKGAWIIKRINMTIPTPMGKAGKMTIEYKNMKLNQGIRDEMFEE